MARSKLKQAFKERAQMPTSKMWAPFRPSDLFRRQIDELFPPTRFHPVRREPSATIPPIEVTREGDEYVIRVDAPGSDPEEIDISFVGNSLVVRGSRQSHRSNEADEVLHCEIAHGNYERIIELPTPMRPHEIKAVYKRGILELRIVAEAKPVRRIPVQTASDKAQSNSPKK
jgi:HSP20 family protein